MWLITSNAGHFLFDATADETAHLVLENIRTAGFNPRDIKYLIITHPTWITSAAQSQIRRRRAAPASLCRWKIGRTPKLQDAAAKA